MTFRPKTDLMVSVFAHLAVLVLIFLFSEVHQFDQVAADTVPVNIVTPQEIAESTPEPTPSPTPTPQFELPSLDTPPTPEAASKQATSQPAEKQPAQKEPAQKQPAQKQPPVPQPSQPPQQAAKAEPPPAPQPPPPKTPTPPLPEAPQQPVPQQQAPPQQQAYLPPQPDLSVKYGVILGLPPDLSAAAPAGPHSADLGGAENFDAPATEEAKVGSGVVGEFRRHLKTCLKLPDTVSSGDDVKVKLRVFMTTDGKLAGPPQLIEATASEKGPLLIQSAISALKSCQPYAMLPRDRYGEWKVLDLDFTPRDFAS